MLKRKHVQALIVSASLLFLTVPGFANASLFSYFTFDAASAPHLQDTIEAESIPDSVRIQPQTTKETVTTFTKPAAPSKLIAPTVKLHPQAASYVKTYLKKNSDQLLQIWEKKGHYFALMDSVFCMYELPLELKYLAIVESELKATAVSQVGAGGPWQLMPSTARLLGLKITARKDERNQYYKSTMAAARYLKMLHHQYKDWLLVIAAYNCGPGNVNKAIRTAGSRNFWRLQQHLPAETRNHVKRFISTHYYFEGAGGVTTVTGAEAVAYVRAHTAYAAKQKNAAAIAINLPAEPQATVHPQPEVQAEVVLQTKTK